MARLIAEKRGLTLFDREIIEHADADREAFVRKYFHADCKDPANYDLAINTEKLNQEAAADTVCFAMEAIKPK